MLKSKVEEALNKQLNEETYSAYLYWSMAAYFHSIALDGFANWMRVQALEELTHAEKFYNYINDRGGRVLLQEIKGPDTEWESPLAAFEAALEHERHISARIDDLVNLAIEERDHSTNNFLQWFVAEQVEEESTADDIVQRLKLIGDNKGGLFMLNQELGQRQFVPPAAEGGQ